MGAAGSFLLDPSVDPARYAPGLFEAGCSDFELEIEQFHGTIDVHVGE